MRPFELPLVTSAGFAKRNGHGRVGKGADRKPVQRSKERVGHGGLEWGGSRPRQYGSLVMFMQRK